MKVVIGVVVAAIVVLLLFTVVFPWVDRTFLADPVMQSAPRGLHHRVLQFALPLQPFPLAWAPGRAGG